MDKRSLSSTQQKQLSDFTTAVDRFLTLIEPLGEADLDLREEPDGWSIRQIVHHVSDDGDVWAFQMKRALATPGVAMRLEGLPGNEAWANALHFDERAIGPALMLIKAHNSVMAELAASIPDAWEQGITFQPENGEAGSICVADMLSFLTAHQLEHTATVERILEKKAQEQKNSTR
jgi:hypothetical protein